MAQVAQRRIVHKQFNSPIGLYSNQNVKETLDRELKTLNNGAVGWVWNNFITNIYTSSKEASSQSALRRPLLKGKQEGEKIHDLKCLIGAYD